MDAAQWTSRRQAARQHNISAGIRRMTGPHDSEARSPLWVKSRPERDACDTSAKYHYETLPQLAAAVLQTAVAHSINSFTQREKLRDAVLTFEAVANGSREYLRTEVVA
jgi:hypothetical protein